MQHLNKKGFEMSTLVKIVLAVMGLLAMAAFISAVNGVWTDIGGVFG
jgi:hypothetical protein